MKKLIALALALVMVLGLAVSAFAASEIVLDLDDGDDDAELKEVKFLDFFEDDDLSYKAEGGTYYFTVAEYDSFKNVAVESTGAVTAKLVKYDPEVFEDIGLDYYIVKKEAGSKTYFDRNGGDWNWYEDKTDSHVDNFKGNYDIAKETLDDIKEEYKGIKTLSFAIEYDTTMLVEVTVEENYTAAYKKGTVKVIGTSKKVDGKYDGKTYAKTVNVISDVIIFGYEDVKDAAKNGYALSPSKNAGYSDYMTEKLGYGGEIDQSEALKMDSDPVVICTTAFKAITGKDITFCSDGDKLAVTIKEVAEGQKGVNFTYDEDVTLAKDVDKDGEYDRAEDAVKTYEFGFKGKQVIASPFTISFELDTNWYELREAFKVKLEEEDVVAYYLTKDGKEFDKIVVDYGKKTVTANGVTKEVEMTDDIELEINGKAGETLGWYTVQLTAPAAEEPEENPNTGAETVVGAVVALAVVSMASAAAISLKK